MGEGDVVGEGDLVWLTGQTPYEFLPLPGGTQFQFFCLVVGDISEWDSDNYTHNPMGTNPHKKVKIVHGGDKVSYCA